MRRILLGLCLLLTSHAFAQSVNTLTELQDSIKRIMEKEHIPGLMIALVHRDSVIWEGGLGTADLRSQTPVNSHHRFRVGSITKTFTALAIQQLVREGKFGLESKLSEIAPEIQFANPWESTEPVRLIHLLEHTAGFDDMHLNALINTTGKVQTRLQEIATQQKSLTCRWKPGTRYSYCNPGYTLLGFIIEKYSGQPYEKYVEEHILLPMGMKETVFDYEEVEPYASGYSWDDSWYPAGAPKINGNAAGAISSTAHDMARFVRMLLNNGQLDSARIALPEELRRMETQQTTPAAQAGLSMYGQAIVLKNYGNPKARKPFYGHDGGIMGFISDFSYNTEMGIGFVLSNNGENQMKSIGNLVAEYLYRGHERPTANAVAIPKEEIESYVGHYRAVNSRNQIAAWVDYLLNSRSVSFRKDTLRVQAFLGDEVALIPVGKNLFRKSTDGKPGAALIESDGEKIMYIDRAYHEKTSLVALWLPRVLVIMPILFGLLLLPVYIVWVVRKFLRKIKGWDLWLRTIPMLSLLSFVSMIVAFGGITSLRNIALAASINAATLTILVLSIATPVLAALSTWLSVRHRTEIGSGFARFCTLSLSVGMLAVSAFLGINGWLGLALWAY